MENGWYNLRSQGLGDAKCLESNDPDKNQEPGATSYAGSSQMIPCGNYSGQHWKWESDGDWFRLKSHFQTDERCLDSNDPSLNSYGGNVYMADCADTKTQRWKFLAQ